MKKAVVLLLSFLLMVTIFLQYIPRVPQVAAQEQWPTVTASANPTSGPEPLTVQFSVVVSGGTPPYTYSWSFGDATPDGTEQNPTHTYTWVFYYTWQASVTVRDNLGYYNTSVVYLSYSTATVTPTTTPTTAPTETPNTTPTTTNEGITLTGIQGNVVVERNGVAITTSSLQPGDQITTGDGSSATITFADGSKVELGPNTSIGETQSLITLLIGKIHALLSRNFAVQSPIAVCAIRGTEFVVEVSANGTTTLTVLSHVVDFSDIGGLKTVSVDQDQTSVVTQGGVPSDPVALNPSQIDRWWEGQGTSGASALPIYAVAATAIVVAVIVVTLLLLRKRPKSEHLQPMPPPPPPPPPPA